MSRADGVLKAELSELRNFFAPPPSQHSFNTAFERPGDDSCSRSAALAFRAVIAQTRHLSRWQNPPAPPNSSSHITFGSTFVNYKETRDIYASLRGIQNPTTDPSFEEILKLRDSRRRHFQQESAALARLFGDLQLSIHTLLLHTESTLLFFFFLELGVQAFYLVYVQDFVAIPHDGSLPSLFQHPPSLLAQVHVHRWWFAAGLHRSWSLGLGLAKVQSVLHPASSSCQANVHVSQVTQKKHTLHHRHQQGPAPIAVVNSQQMEDCKASRNAAEAWKNGWGPAGELQRRYSAQRPR